jgi:hypothetical protein
MGAKPGFLVFFTASLKVTCFVSLCLVGCKSASVRLLSNAKWAIFQLYHDEKKLRFDEMMMMSTLY